MDRQLRIVLVQQPPMRTLVLDAELQDRLITLMAEAIVVILESDGGDDNECLDSQPQD